MQEETYHGKEQIGSLRVNIKFRYESIMHDIFEGD